MKFDFNNQTAIVTGGTRGIGKAISEAFLQAGAKVIAAYRSNDQAAEAFKVTNAEFSDRLILKKLDVTQYKDVEEFFQFVSTECESFEIRDRARSRHRCRDR